MRYIPIKLSYSSDFDLTQHIKKRGEKYSAESIRSIIKWSAHLLENGVDIRYIQELLGHSSPKTTMIYTHVSRKDLMNIHSPLDEALKQPVIWHINQ